MNSLAVEQRQLREQYEDFSVKTKQTQSEILEHTKAAEDADDCFITKIQNYEKTNYMIEQEISTLSKQLRDNNNAINIFKLSRISRANGIHKSEKDDLRHPKRIAKRTTLTPLSESRSRVRSKALSLSDTTQNHEIENQSTEVLSFVTEESPQRSASAHEKAVHKDKKLLECLDLNIIG